MSNKLKYIIQIDGLRCFAVLGVLMSHYIISDLNNEIIKRIPFGTGVNLFFVISGYLITSILLSSKKDIELKISTIGKELKKFFLKRVLRIFPLYYLVILLLILFKYDEVKDYLIYLANYTTNIYMTFHNTYIDKQTHLWSLAVEEQFYLIWPFIIFLVNKKHFLKVIVSFIALSLFSKYYFINSEQFQIGSNAFLTSCFDSLGFGALLAYLQLYHSSFFERIMDKRILFILILAYIIIFVFPGFTNSFIDGMFNNFLTSLIYFFVVGIAAQNKFKGVLKYTLENKIAIYIGKISYGIYIIHNFASEIFYNFLARKLPPTDHQSVRIMYWVIITIVLSSISWYIVEKPFLRLKRFFN